MKVSKEFNERRSEIIDVARRLFLTKGYDKCTVNDILDAVGIAKGTFYYYFKSKEEVLDAIIGRVTETVVERAVEAASNPELSPVIKMLNIMLSMRVESQVDDDLMEELHKPQNALMHQKSLSLMVTRVAPILTKVVDDGISQGIFKSDFPMQYMQIFLTSSITLLDDGIFQVKPEEQQMTLRALIALLEKMLGVADDSFWNVAKQYWG
ncbi:TetR/AcrR family transcriptional regulator [Sedimentibacter sp. zth1]|uniref:TetR/AcrR family transcriptional regulator n=1 Tax=Sedimentibacter sp. zth1 TaxID=2816908 RepID=UPI001A935CF2|nr:TetR/AcrR family transcriptional regulator [Sedimentibacter sp. zth1]QSX05667.1 TetR/AcrR family transcriptional regulator [Sedimentibacter sp. zth1]